MSETTPPIESVETDERPGEILWVNKEGGNNHSLHFDKGFLVFYIQKPGMKKPKKLDPAATKSAIEEWKIAFEGAGPQWTQIPNSESKESTDKGELYRAQRFRDARTECVEWMVSHLKPIDGGEYVVEDEMYVVKKT